MYLLARNQQVICFPLRIASIVSWYFDPKAIVNQLCFSTENGRCNTCVQHLCLHKNATRAICVWLCLTRSCILHLLVGSTCRTQDLQVSKLRRLPLAWGTGFRRDHQLVWHCSTASTTGYTPRGGTACSNIGASDLLCFPLTPSSALRPGHSTVSNIFIFQLISMKASVVGNARWRVVQKSGTAVG